MSKDQAWGLRVEWVHEGKRRIVGSGAFVGPRHVLTARHVALAEGAAEAREGLRVRPAAGLDPIPVSAVHWDREDPEPADVAVLELAEPHGLATVGPHRGAVANGERWGAGGWPVVDLHHPSTDYEQVQGTACELEPGNTDWLHLDISVPPRSASGLSGAVVRLEGAFAGVIAKQAASWEKGARLKAVPNHRFLGSEWYEKALGRDESEEAKRLRGLAEGRISDLLDDAPAVARALNGENLLSAAERDAVDLLALLKRAAKNLGKSADKPKRLALWHLFWVQPGLRHVEC